MLKHSDNRVVATLLRVFSTSSFSISISRYLDLGDQARREGNGREAEDVGQVWVCEAPLCDGCVRDDIVGWLSGELTLIRVAIGSCIIDVVRM
jgi:hypothetical protein